MASKTLAIGKKAPAFSLLDQGGDKVGLSDHSGSWVVLYFYPKDDTPGCTTEACEFSAGTNEFQKLDAIVLGVSPDPVKRHDAFYIKYDLKHILLSDPDHKVIERYGAWGEKTMYGKKKMGVVRSTWIIDPEGRLAWHWSKVKAAGHADEVAAKLKELRGG